MNVTTLSRLRSVFVVCLSADWRREWRERAEDGGNEINFRFLFLWMYYRLILNELCIFCMLSFVMSFLVDTQWEDGMIPFFLG